MKTIAGRGRKILSRLFRGISVLAVSLLLPACYNNVIPPDEPAMYGMPPPHENEQTTIRGKVQSKKTGEPIFGIKVSIEGTNYSARTDEDGYFNLWVRIQNVYKLKLEDVDGPYNGGLFKEQTWTIKRDDSYYNLLIGMDLDTSEPETGTPGTQTGTETGTETGCCGSESETDGGQDGAE